MGTVLIDEYGLRCRSCGFTTQFLVGAGAGDIAAVERARQIHDESTTCDDKEQHLELEVVVIRRA